MTKKLSTTKKLSILGVSILAIALTITLLIFLREDEEEATTQNTLGFNEETGEWDELFPFRGDNNLRGYKDEHGNVVIEAQFLWADYFSEGLAFVATPEDVEEVFGIPHTGFAITNGQGSGYINLAGELVIPLAVNYSAGQFSEGFAHVVERRWDWEAENPRIRGTPGPFIFIDREGRNAFGQEFLSVNPFQYGFARVSLIFGGSIFIDTTGQNAFGLEFRNTRDFVDGYARVTLLDGTITYIDMEGTIHQSKQLLP